MTARSLPSPFRPTARRSRPAAISAPGWATSRPMATSACSISRPARSRQSSRRPTTPSTTSPSRRTGASLRPAARTASSMSGRHDEAEATGWKPFTQARRRFLAHPATGLRRWRQADWSRRRPTTASGCGTCRPAPKSRCPMPSRCAISRSWRWRYRPTARCLRPATMTASSQVRKAADGTLVRAMPKQEFLIGSLTFAAGGARLVASCGYRCADKNRTIVWTRRRRPAGAASIAAMTARSMRARPAPTAALVATAGGTQARDPALGPADRRAEEGAARRRRAGDGGRHRS